MYAQIGARSGGKPSSRKYFGKLFRRKSFPSGNLRGEERADMILICFIAHEFVCPYYTTSAKYGAN